SHAPFSQPVDRQPWYLLQRPVIDVCGRRNSLIAHRVRRVRAAVSTSTDLGGNCRQEAAVVSDDWRQHLRGHHGYDGDEGEVRGIGCPAWFPEDEEIVPHLGDLGRSRLRLERRGGRLLPSSGITADFLGLLWRPGGFNLSS